jgi:hypothetical protein
VSTAPLRDVDFFPLIAGIGTWQVTTMDDSNRLLFLRSMRDPYLDAQIAA